MTGGSSNAQDTSIADNFSLVSGGPFYRALHRMGLAPGHYIYRVVAWLMVTCLPILVLSLVQGTAWGNKVKIPLLYDFSMYGRFLVALPILIVAETVLDPFIRRLVSMFNTSGIVKEGDLAAYHAALEKVARSRDSGLVELLLALLAFFPFFLLAAKYEWISSLVTTWHGTTSGGLSPAGWWFVFVASPALRFLMFRWIWRYTLWSELLRKISNLNLDLVPTHPDRLAGLGFLLFVQQQFGILAAALGSVIAGQFANEVVHFGKTIAGIRAPTGVFIGLSVVIILLPLTLFSFKLFEARRDGLVRYHRLARGVSGGFDVKWAREASPPPESMIGSQDPSSLIDYISSYDVIAQARVIPISRRAVLYIGVLAAAPFAVVWLLGTPLEHLIAEILKKLL